MREEDDRRFQVLEYEAGPCAEPGHPLQHGLPGKGTPQQEEPMEIGLSQARQKER